MWDPFANSLEIGRTFLPLGVLMASLFGSWHCVTMCGGLITASTHTHRGIWMYHLGRLLGYGSLGALAGLLGERILSTALTGILPWISTLALGAGFILMGIFSWNGPPRLKLPNSFLKLYHRLWKGMLHQGEENLLRSGGVGLLSVFLPCGWLYSFVLAAVATQNPIHGSLLLFAFWLGSLPALSFAPLLVRKFLAPFGRRAPKIAAVLLMSIGLWTLAMKISPLLFHSQSHSTAPMICTGLP